MNNKDHVLNDAARQLRQAAKWLDKIADDIKHDVIADGSIKHGLGVAESKIDAAVTRMKAFA